MLLSLLLLLGLDAALLLLVVLSPAASAVCAVFPPAAAAMSAAADHALDWSMSVSEVDQPGGRTRDACSHRLSAAALRICTSGCDGPAAETTGSRTQ
jgi:hypothetical protein